MTLDIEKFNPTVAELHSLVETTKLANLPDPRNTAQVKVIRGYRIQLRDARVVISKRGKELRQEALTFQKAVIAKEKELIGIIEPEETRLQALEDTAEVIAEMDARQAVLPARKERLAQIADGVEIADEELLKMDDTAFDAYANQRVATKNEKQRIDLERREREVKEKELAQQREREKAEAEERGRTQERERLEREQRERVEREERERRAKEERLERERLERERLEREEKERLERDTKYQMFLTAHGCTGDTTDFHIQKIVNTVRLYKLIGTLEL